MAKVLLVQPKYNPDTENPSLHVPIPSIVLATAISYKGHEAKILDRNLYPSDTYLKNVIKRFDPDIVGLTAYIGKTLLDLIEVCKIVKSISNALIVVGGIQATVEPKPLLDKSFVDYVVRGEGELALIDMCNLIDKKKKNFSKIPNVNYIPMRPFINLNDFPIPDYSFAEIKKYPLVTFLTSRGCPGNCTFCYNNYYWGKLGKKCVRMYNAKNTIEMITSNINKYKLKEFYIVDDNFANLSKRTSKVCKELSKSNSIFQCSLRSDFAQDKIMYLLKKAGCWSIQFGIESGSQRILDFIKKGTNIQQNIKAIKQCKKFGIFSDGSYMLGLPGETIKEMMQTVKFIRKNKTDAISAKKFTPFPGTEIFEYCVKQRLLKKPKKLEDFSVFEFLNSPEPTVSDIPPGLLMKTIEDLNKPDYFSYLKKLIMLLRGGHYKYVFRKAKQKIIKEK